MIKKGILVLFISLVSIGLFAVPPEGYYQSAYNTFGDNLRLALHQIIDGHNDVGYNGLWTLYGTSDLKDDGTIWDMYSTCVFSYRTDQCGNYASVCDCYNREHSLPKSWFGNSSPMKSDAFHIYPTDGKVNGVRGNDPFGECANGTTVDSHQLGRSGHSTFPGYSGNVFEPADQYKGDFARTYFYMVTRYSNKKFNIGNGASCFTYNSSASTLKSDFTDYAVALFLKWHRQDPVSQKEIDRNDAIYNAQHNRNPFIDHPELAEFIWGNQAGQVWNGEPTTSQEKVLLESLSIYPNPSYGNITFKGGENFDFNYEIYTLTNTLIDEGKSGVDNEINIRNLSTGIYILKLRLNNVEVYKRIIVLN